MIDAGSQVQQALLTAVLLPAGLIVTLLAVRLLAACRYTLTRSRPLPIVVHPLNFEHNKPDFVDGQKSAMLELPSRLRDFVSEDENLRPRLAPGPVSPVAPSVSSAAPGNSEGPSWNSFLLELVFPRARPAYNLILVPEVPSVGLGVGAQVVRSPGNKLVMARSFQASDMDELVTRIGGFCIEVVQEQPAVLRRSPRWEHWNPGSYTAYRRALRCQQAGVADDAHKQFNDAASLAPGNIHVALRHGSLHESRNEFKEAARTYNAASCLWKQNIDIGFRLAAATVNYVLSNQLPSADTTRLLSESIRILERVTVRVQVPSLLRSLLIVTLNPRRRDPGERRYWFSWLRPDPYRAPLRLLRRTKGHEYRSALRVAIAGFALLTFTIGDLRTSSDPVPVRNLWREVLDVSDKKRSGWLAHWSAACFFSRAMGLRPELQPPRDEWTTDLARIRAGSSSRFGAIFDGAMDGSERASWKEYCKERAISELGRVIRNPCSQLDPSLLLRDPDMKRLQDASEGQLVAVLAGFCA